VLGPVDVTVQVAEPNELRVLQLRQNSMVSSLHSAGATEDVLAASGSATLATDGSQLDRLAPAAAIGQQPQLAQLLGLSISGRELLAAVAKSVAVTVMLFLGPLHHKAQIIWQRHRQKGLVAWWVGDGQPLLHQLRDYVVSPLAEEWSFRSCMVPLLWMQVRAEVKVCQAAGQQCLHDNQCLHLL
jgi:hypothetical protein